MISLLINFPYAQNKLFYNQTAIWSIALNVLVNPCECSIVRSQACAFLINLTNSLAHSILSASSTTSINTNSELEEYVNATKCLILFLNLKFY